ncbi:MAG: hypothetical protein HOQ45_18495 [Nocardioidaceae bacterium]|nr:hypothetical protein [Nocardioidaceae bacterium]
MSDVDELMAVVLVRSRKGRCWITPWADRTRSLIVPNADGRLEWLSDYPRNVIDEAVRDGLLVLGLIAEVPEYVVPGGESRAWTPGMQGQPIMPGGGRGA